MGACGASEGRIFLSDQTIDYVTIAIGERTFKARFEDEVSPKTCAAFRAVLPFRSKLIHCRWSGESTWVPLGDYKLGDVGFEGATCYPAAGEILFYPGGYSETEILVPYGHANFASTMGQLAGNHFLTVIENKEQLKDVGKEVLWEGAQDIVFTALAG